jgi:hypothetical protein
LIALRLTTRSDLLRPEAHGEVGGARRCNTRSKSGLGS